MARYYPKEGDLLIESVYGRKQVHIIIDVDVPEVTYERPDGVQVTKYLTELRQDLDGTRFAVQPAEAQEAE